MRTPILYIVFSLVVRITYPLLLGPHTVNKSPLSYSQCRPLLMQSNGNNQERRLQGAVCVVTGASRGIGRGIAIELGRAGATVYITGTSTRSNTPPSSSKFISNYQVGGPETIEETASLVEAAGGYAIPVFCDHSDDSQVKDLFHRVEQTHGRLDLLVNNAFRLPSGGSQILQSDFWSEQGIEMWDAVHTIGLRSHYVASCYAVPLMMKAAKDALTHSTMKSPLIVMISSFGGTCYTFNVAYGVGKAGVDRLAKDMALVLRDKGIAVNSIYPGVVMTERMISASKKDPDWAKQVGIPLDFVESPFYTGKAIVALATDKDCISKTGSIQVVSELAKEYGFTDTDGKQPPSIRSLKFLLPTYAFDQETKKKIPNWLIPDFKLPFFVMASPPPIRE